jgi:hypothetical protein
LLLVVAISTIGAGVGIHFYRRQGKQQQPESCNPTMKATEQGQLQTENEQQADDGYEVPLNDNVRGGDAEPLHVYADVTEEGNDPLKQGNRQNQKTGGDYELPIHEYSNLADDDHAYDKVSRPNDATYQEI